MVSEFLTVRVDAALLARIDRLAKAEREQRSETVLRLVMLALAQAERQGRLPGVE